MKFSILRSLLLPSVLLSLLANASTYADVKYQVRITNAAQHLAEVTVEFPAVQATSLDVQMPIWRTGRYEVLNLPKNVRVFTATDGKGKKLDFVKTDKSTWQVKTSPGDTVKVSYELYANALGERTLHIDDTHAYLDASGVMMYAAPFRDQAVSVHVDAPKEWVSRSGMEKGNCEHCFVAPNYDVLVDSPIESGLHEFTSFDVDGRAIEVLIWGKGNHDIQKIAVDLKKIVIESKKMLGDFPFKKRYLFIVHATDGVGGATEHINSTVIQTSRWNFFPKKSYSRFIGTAAHEFVHTWNVKSYRSKEMVPYQFQTENYSTMLWIAEGHTSYLEELVSLRTGLKTRDEFLENIAKSLQAYEHQPGRFQQSAAESSFESWINESGERARNASVNIYSKGSLLGMAMDIEIRSQTKGAKGLEHLHQYLYAHHKVSQGGYSDADVRKGLLSVTGQDWSQWWSDYVDGVKEIPTADLLAKVGLVYAVEAGKDDEQKEEWFTGWGGREGSDFLTVSEVERDSPAWKAGVVAGDMLIAANGIRLTSKEINDRLWTQQQTPIKLLVFRRDELKELNLTPTRKTKGKAKVKAIEKVSGQQKELNAKWMGVAWPAASTSTKSKED
jgi:predicted metalloprotease with PDZ domain